MVALQIFPWESKHLSVSWVVYKHAFNILNLFEVGRKRTPIEGITEKCDICSWSMTFVLFGGS